MCMKTLNKYIRTCSYGTENTLSLSESVSDIDKYDKIKKWISDNSPEINNRIKDFILKSDNQYGLPFGVLSINIVPPELSDILNRIYIASADNNPSGKGRMVSGSYNHYKHIISIYLSYKIEEELQDVIDIYGKKSPKVFAKQLQEVLDNVMVAINEVLLHELVHVYDEKTHKMSNRIDSPVKGIDNKKEINLNELFPHVKFDNPILNPKQLNPQIRYLNQGNEINAFLIQIIDKYFQETHDTDIAFNTLIEYLMKIKFFYYAIPANRKKIIKRAYQLFNHINSNKNLTESSSGGIINDLGSINVNDIELVSIGGYDYEVHLKNPELDAIFADISIDELGDRPIITIEENGTIHFTGLPTQFQRISLARKIIERVLNDNEYIKIRSDSSDGILMIGKSLGKRGYPSFIDKGNNIWIFNSEDDYEDLQYLFDPESALVESIEISDTVIDAHSGQLDGRLYAKDNDGNILGYMDYTEYDNTPSISMVEVDPAYRRKGIGSALYKKLQSLYPDKELGTSGTTPDGAAIRKAMEPHLYKDPNKQNAINTLKALHRRAVELDKSWSVTYDQGQDAIDKLDEAESINDAKIRELEAKYPPYKTGIYSEDPNTFMENTNSHNANIITEAITNKPMHRIMYHGSDTFNGGEFNTTNGIWTISDKEEAEQYGDNVFTLEVTVNNPYISSHEEKTKKLGDRKLLQKAKSLGHDSVFIPSDYDYYELNIYDEAKYDVLIAFTNDQVKLLDNPDTLTESINPSNIVMYHGSNQSFNSFKLGLDEKGVTSKYGFWFTDSLDEAKQYGHQSSTRMRSNQEQHDTQINSYMDRIEKAERKGDWDLHDKLTHEMEELEFSDDISNKYFVYKAKINLHNPLTFDSSKSFDQETIIKRAIKDGHDGVIFINISDSPYGLPNTTNQIVVFNADNIEIIDFNDYTSDAIMESIDDLSDLDSLVNDMSNERDQQSNDELSKLALSLSEKDYLKELITGEERYKYRKYLTKFSTDVSTDSLISEQAVEDDMVKQWYDIIEFKRPLIIVSGNKIIDGHHKYTAYKMRDIDTVPVIQINDLLKFYNDQVRN